MAVRAATMAGEPKPCVIMEKWVRCFCMPGSRIMAGFVLQRGDRSWFNRSISSLVIILEIHGLEMVKMRVQRIFFNWGRGIQIEKRSWLKRSNNFYVIIQEKEEYNLIIGKKAHFRYIFL